jgi:hypothetical protein
MMAIHPDSPHFGKSLSELAAAIAAEVAPDERTAAYVMELLEAFAEEIKRQAIEL